MHHERVSNYPRLSTNTRKTTEAVVGNNKNMYSSPSPGSAKCEEDSEYLIQVQCHCISCFPILCIPNLPPLHTKLINKYCKFSERGIPKTYMPVA